MLSKKYGMSLQQANDANTQITSLAAVEGLDYHFEKAHNLVPTPFMGPTK